MTYNCIICNSTEFEHILNIDKKPPLETDYKIPAEKYNRNIVKCKNCGAYLNQHNLLDEAFYSGNYNDAIELGTLKTRFEKIINLPENISDNKSRVKRVLKYIENYGIKSSEISVLDIGSGTCVFLYEMKKHVQKTTCIDPDFNAISHAKNVVKVDDTFHGSVVDFNSKNKYDLITLNKVLEHLKSPIEVLIKIKNNISENGLLYIELPHSEPIIKQNTIFEHSEFFVEHYSIHNETSIKKIAEIASYSILDIGEIVDPSGKFTIFAFLKPL